MRTYVSNVSVGSPAAHEQVELLTAQEQRLADEAQRIALRQRYVRIKIDYWHAVESGDTARAHLLSGQAHALANEIRDATKQ